MVSFKLILSVCVLLVIQVSESALLRHRFEIPAQGQNQRILTGKIVEVLEERQNFIHIFSTGSLRTKFIESVRSSLQEIPSFDIEAPLTIDIIFDSYVIKELYDRGQICALLLEFMGDRQPVINDHRRRLLRKAMIATNYVNLHLLWKFCASEKFFNCSRRDLLYHLGAIDEVKVIELKAFGQNSLIQYIFIYMLPMLVLVKIATYFGIIVENAHSLYSSLPLSFIAMIFQYYYENFLI